MTVILGHTFRPMTQLDWNCFAGADEGSLIAWTADSVLIWSPLTKTITEIDDHDETEWTPKDPADADEIERLRALLRQCLPHLTGPDRWQLADDVIAAIQQPASSSTLEIKREYPWKCPHCGALADDETSPCGWPAIADPHGSYPPCCAKEDKQ